VINFEIMGEEGMKRLKPKKESGNEDDDIITKEKRRNIAPTK
jgi:hypothetical protein